MARPFTRLVSFEEENTLLRQVAKDLARGSLVAFPTETVYGLGASIFREAALERIFRVKGRPGDNPLIVHVCDPAQARELMARIPPSFEELVRRFWPGPLTLVVPRNAAVPDRVTAGLDTVGLRMPRHAFALALLREAGIPVAAPSANLSGRPSPTTAEEVWHDLAGRIPWILDGGPCQVGIESTVLDLSSSRPRVLRPGFVSADDIAEVLGRPVPQARSTSARPASPGMKYRHYAPSTPLVLSASSRLRQVLAQTRERAGSVGLIAPSIFENLPADGFWSLGEGTPVDYARQLYAALRGMDRRGFGALVIPTIHGSPLARALMNRLSKAAAPFHRPSRSA